MYNSEAAESDIQLTMIVITGNDFHAIFTWFVVIPAVLQFVGTQKQESVLGNMCTYQGTTSRNGQCKLLSDCSNVIENLLYNKILPQPCGFEGTEVVVCCDVISVSKESPVQEDVPEKNESKLIDPLLIKSDRLEVPKEDVLVKNKSKPTNSMQTFLDSLGDAPKETKSLQKCKEYAKQFHRFPNYQILEYVNNGFSYSIGDMDIKFCSQFTPIGRNDNNNKARLEEFPFMAAIGYGEAENKSWFCSGALISEQFVLTSGRCLSNRSTNREPKYIRLGDLHLGRDDDNAEPQEFNVAQIYIHPDFKQPSFYNDIGLIKLDKLVNFTDFIRPACLYTTLDLRRAGLVAMGWDNQTELYMRSRTRTFVSHSECRTLYKKNTRKLKEPILDEIQLCVGRERVVNFIRQPLDEIQLGAGREKVVNLNRDPCMGEGPLMGYNNEQYCMYNLMGIASFFRSCGDTSDVPDVYTRVSAYIPWIEGIVWPLPMNETIIKKNL